MNTQNVGSLEACKRLVDAGIVLETDFYWYLPHKPTMCGKTTWFIERKYYLLVYTEMFPAPSMAEVWRELPEEYCKNATDPIRYKVLMSSQVGYHSGGKDGGIWIPYKGNPTDALIDLLIWVKEKS